MKKLYTSQITDHLAEEIIDDFFIRDITLCHTKESGTPYLSLKLEDKKGYINGRIWENNIEDMHFNLKGKVATVHGELLMDFNHSPELIIWKLEPATDYDIHEFVKGLSQEETDRYMEILNKQIALVEHIGYKDLLSCVFERIHTKFVSAPASLSHTGNYNGGLLVQTVCVTSIALQIMRSQRLFSRHSANYIDYQDDLLITGSLLFGTGLTDLYTPYPEAARISEASLIQKPLLTIKLLVETLPYMSEFLSAEELNLIYHLIQTAYNGQHPKAMNREALVLNLAYQTYLKVSSMEMFYEKNPDGTGIIFDSDSKNYLYFSKIT